MTTTDDLLDMSVDDQKDELENLEVNQLQELKEEEKRSTALDNIDRELGNRKTNETIEEKASSNEVIGDVKVETKDDRLDKLEKKVDYIISRCKTTSEEGFENYDN